MKKKFDFDIVSKKKLFITIPSALLAALVIFTVIFGAVVSIEFTGGTILTYVYHGELNANTVKTEVDALNLGNSAITTGELRTDKVEVETDAGLSSDVKTLTITFSASDGLSNEQQDVITTMLLEKFTGNIRAEYYEDGMRREQPMQNQSVSPSTGTRFFLKCLVAFVFAFIMFIIYIAFRFKKLGGWSTGMFALIGLFVDVMVVVAVFVFFRLPIDSIFMAVVLAIMGYSINNTIILYDRVRENKTLHGTRLTGRELVNLSVRQSLTRTINTTVTTAAALVVLSIVAYIFGVGTILNFAFPMLIGLISGVYTTLCLSGTFWVMWQERKLTKKA